MKQVLLQKGKAFVADVPAPKVNDDQVLVQVAYSAISAGTEVSAIRNSGKSVLASALEKPQNIAKVAAMVKERGFSGAVRQIMGKLEETQAVGYSASGVVVAVGKGIEDIRVGDRVACAGAGIANHAQLISVPRNLCVKVPQGVSLKLASTVTLGSIALQGIRRTDPKLGESTCVIGLGILGQLTVQMLKANGIRVVGVDVDRSRVDTAVALGMDRGLVDGLVDENEEILRFSGGCGVDSVIVTASSAISDILNNAMKIVRKKGRVVVVGAVGMDIEREDFYKKELDLLISTSYGPGRYDEKYETQGVDYPYAYVRWTENRNMAAYLELVDRGVIKLEMLISGVYPIESAGAAYEKLRSTSSKPMIMLLEYDKEVLRETKVVVCRIGGSNDRIQVALIGAGGFAKTTLLPNFGRLSKYYQIYAVVSGRGENALATASKCNAQYASTDYEEVLRDEHVDMVVVATRHNRHAEIAIQAAKAGKAVFLEKPMALNESELAKLIEVLEETKVPFTVGFNRRFSPYAQKIDDITRSRINPMIINYRMNAGYIPRDNWVHSDEGGGRNIGEACHIYDLFTFLTNCKVNSVIAHSITPVTDQYLRNDNFVVSMKFEDGSVCNLIYTSLGSNSVPKEQMDIYFDGKVVIMNDYRAMSVFGRGNGDLKTARQEKGHSEELSAFAKSVREGNGYPIPLWQLVQSSKISFDVEEIL